MKIEFTLAEIEAIILQHANQMTGQIFDTVEGTAYRSLPNGFVVSKEKKEDEPQ